MGTHPLRELHLFAGAGGGILAGQLLGHQCVCAVEINHYCQSVLMQRQKDGVLPEFPIWDNVCTFDGNPWRERVDIIAGGFPCQDISDAGTRQGISGTRSGLWSEFARLIGEIRPRYAFIENTAALAHRGLERVLSDLARMGYDARWCCLGADDVGAPHIRKRLWILAYSEKTGRQQLSTKEWQDLSYAHRNGENVPNAYHPWKLQSEGIIQDIGGRPDNIPQENSNSNSARFSQWESQRENYESQQPTAERTDWWITQSSMGLLADGMADSMDGPWNCEPGDVPRVVQGMSKRVAQIQALGNGQVPLCAAVAWLILSDGVMSP